jgi:phosphoserine phosphatase
LCVATSSEKMVPSDIAFLKDYLKAEKEVVLGSFGVQFEIEKKLIATDIEIGNGKKIDLNFLSDNDRSVNLLVSDMDGTLLEEECIDEIAELVGKGPEVKKITALAMKEGLNFEEALERRLALIKGTEIEVLEKCMAKRINIRYGAKVLFKTFKKHFGDTAILSGGFTFFSDRIQRELKADFSFANVLEFKNNRLTGKILGSVINSEKKTELMKQLSARQGKNISNAVAVGDGNNDIAMIAESHMGISFRGGDQVNLSAKHVLKNSNISAILYLLGLRESQFVY